MPQINTANMATGRLQLLPLVLAIGACTLLLSTLNFVSAPAATERSTRALRALPQPGAKTEETSEDEGFKMPKPDMSILNRQAKVGSSVDQDRRGNMWSVESPLRVREDEGSGELLPAGIYFPIAILFVIASIIFFAQLIGNDDRFGGMLGDDARGINEWG